MKIGIFGGTFNPIHMGHINMIKDIKSNLKLDVVYFVPTYQTPDKEFQIEKITPKDRYKMTSLALKEINEPWLKISNFEFKQKGTSYTYKTIKHFKEQYPDDKLYWIMGEDRYFGFKSWKNYEYIKENSKIVVFRRSDKVNKQIKEDKSVRYIYNKYYDISSTNILNNIEWDKIPTSTKKYIAKKKLYVKTLVFNVLKEQKYQHSIAVSSHAKRLSNRYRFNRVNDAIFAGLVHDLFKLKSIDWQREYYDKNNKDLDNPFIPDKVLHGFVCAIWLEQEYGIKRKDIISSVKYHTTANKNMNKLDKIIFVADAIATDRKGHKIGTLRKLAYLNLDETFKKILKQTYKIQNNKHGGAHPFTIDGIEQYTNVNVDKTWHNFSLKKVNKKKD